MIARKPGTIERINLGSSGGMDRVDELEMLTQGRIEAARAFGENAAMRQENAGWDYYQEKNADGSFRQYRKNRVTGEEQETGSGGFQSKVGPNTSGSGGTDTTLKPLDVARDQQNKFNEARVLPGAKKWIIGGPGEWRMQNPPTGWFGGAPNATDLADYNAIYKYVYGKEPPSGAQPAAPAAKPTAPVGDQTIGGNNRPPPNAIPTPQRQSGSGRSMPAPVYPVGPEEPARRTSPNQQGGSGRSMPPQQVRPQAGGSSRPMEPGEVTVIDTQTGTRGTMTRENFQKGQQIAPGRYRLEQ